jgi:guanylate kinase
MDYPGNLFVIAAPSGAGKSTLTDALLRREPRIAMSVSYTTRDPRGAEQAGREYYFVSPDEFDAMVERGEFMEWAEVHGYLYGTSARWIEQKMQAGEDVLLEIDWKGALQVRSRFSNATLLFVLPPSFDELKVRLATRGDTAPEIIRRRLANAREEIAKAPLFDYVIINDDFDEALQAILHIVAAQRCRYAAIKQRNPAVMSALGLNS